MGIAEESRIRKVFGLTVSMSVVLALGCGDGESTDTGSTGGAGGDAGAAAGSGGGGRAAGGGGASGGGRAGTPSNGGMGGADGGASGSGGTPTEGGADGGPFERAVCLQGPQQLCTDSMERDAADAKKVCAGEAMGTVVAKCPSEDLLGCCFMPATQGLGDVTYCFYVGVQSGLDQASCDKAGGTWSKTPPP